MAELVNLDGDLQHILIETEKTQEEEVKRCIIKKDNDIDSVYHSYRLKQNYFTKEDLESQDNFSIVRGKNYQYFGGYSDNMRHGMGILIAGDAIYQGFFKLNFKMGKGYLKFSSGAEYMGDFVNSKPHGSGTFVYPSKQVYIGEFQNGLIHGNGMWKSPKGDRYIGQWRNNKADGYGVHIWVNGDKYQGEFKEFLKHGYGIQKFGNGDVYKGQYEGGKPNGQGQYTWTNGSIFKGTFKCGLRHGHGRWHKGVEGGDEYEGMYQNDRKCGYGVFKWSSGNIYKGQFFDDLRHGQGQMIWNDGSYYRGAWEKGVQHGQGVICFKGEKQRSGLFKNNVLVFQDPKIEEITIKNPLIEGHTASELPTNAIKTRRHMLQSYYDEPIQPLRKEVRAKSLIGKMQKKTKDKSFQSRHDGHYDNILSDYVRSPKIKTNRATTQKTRVKR